MTTEVERDERFMRIALVKAQLAHPAPNPPVGAVVVNAEGKIVGKGWHEAAGQPHAEVVALNHAGDLAKGATLYVTLEPCNHHGRTPPCTEAIQRAGIARVVVGCADPNPHVEGGGSARLRAMGIQVTTGVCETEAARLIAPWTTFITDGTPHVTLKLALSLDGRIATRVGASKWVTGPEARAKVQELRARSSAVAVGVGTALADDPLLTVRDPAFEHRKPRRVVFDSKLRISLHSRLAQTANQTKTTLFTTEEASADAEQALVDQGVEVIRVASSGEGRVDLESALRVLASLNVVSLLVEGGAELAGSFLAARAAHELHAFIAPILLGPRGRPGAVDWAGPDRVAEAPHIAEPTWELVGRDAYVFGLLVTPEREREREP